MPEKLIHVAAAAIEDTEGRILITRRHDHVHQGGLWEFPGGKLEPGESVLEALRRELREELGIEPLSPQPLIRVTHHYDDRSVLLDVYRVREISGTPRGMEGQPLEWQRPDEMDAKGFPAADRPILKALQLPGRFLITGAFPERPEQFLDRLDRALMNDLRLVQLRAHQLPDTQYLRLLESVSGLCRQYGAKLLLNRPHYHQDWLELVDGIHLTRHQLMAMERRTEGPRWMGASCHNPAELSRAQRLGLDYALLSPVRATASHPDAKPLGWDLFERWVDEVNLPVYALGGMGPGDLREARWRGAQGIAGISGLWGSDAETETETLSQGS